VTVVGGGLVGLLVSGWLAEAGVDVLLVEAGDHLGASIGLGLVELGVTEYPSRTLASLGERADPLLAWSARSKERLGELGLLEPTGVLWVPVLPGEEAEVERSVDALAAKGVQARVVQVEQLQALGLSARHPALSLPGDGRLVVDAVERLKRWISEHGVRVVTGAKVDAVEEGDGPLRVVVGREAVHTEAVVITGGVGEQALHPSLRGFLPVRDQGVTLAGGQGLPVAGRAGQGWTGWRVDPEGVTVSGARWATPHLEVGERTPRVVDAVQDKLVGFARRTLGVRGEVVRRWAWIFSQSPDGLPVVGPLPGDPRCVGCLGFGSAGTGLAVAAARSVVEGLIGDPEPVPWVLSTRRMVRWRYGR